MLLVAVLVCLFIPTVSSFGVIATLVSFKLGDDCRTVTVTFDTFNHPIEISIKQDKTVLAIKSIPANPIKGTVDFDLGKAYNGTNTFTAHTTNADSQDATFTCYAPVSVFAPPATQDGRINVYAPTNVAVYESITTEGCAFIIKAMDEQKMAYDLVITQAMRDAVTEGLIDGNTYAQFYKLSDGTFQLNVGPYNSAGDMYILNVDNCPNTSVSDKNSTYRNGQ